MGAIKLSSLDDLVQWRCLALIRCNRCGREARYDPAMLIECFRQKRWPTSLASAGQRFKCKGRLGSEGCGATDVRIRAIMPELELPPQVPIPVDIAPPLGVDPAEWAGADDYGKRRLIRRARD